MAGLVSKWAFFRSDGGRLSIVLLVGIALGLAALPSVERFFLVRAGDQGLATLRLAVEGLRGALRRFEPLPGLISERPVLAQMLANPDNSGLQADVNEQLRITADELGASDVYLLDAEGLTIASSNYRKERSFLGRRFAFRPYFTQAAEGGLGRYFALGTTSLERGYFYAAPVMDDGMIVGVLALKFTVDAFEDAWRGGSSDIIVSDFHDIVFMSSREDWHFRTLTDLTSDVLAEITETQQYPLDELVPLTNTRTPLDEPLSLMRVESDAGIEQFVTSSALLDDVGWRVSILVPSGPAKAQALSVFLVFVLFVLFVGLVLMSVLQRRARIMERLDAQRAAHDLLERRVEERTADLNAANAHLRKTQHELVQAGKLAALGQMSAALSHEINQPLAAVKTYAENAGTFLDRDRLPEARENVSRISKLADRMAAISAHLRNFARRPKEDVGPVEVQQSIDDALALMQGRLREAKARVRYDPPTEPVWAHGGQLRLQQVIVNLLSNALDAMEGQSEPRIELALVDEGTDRVRITVRDEGDGLDEETLAQLFDPFFTTKGPGKGLGLGLSISYNIVKDFGGHLNARNRDGVGAEFSIDLKRAETAVAEDQTLPSRLAAE